jgi:hypothetical protein
VRSYIAVAEVHDLVDTSARVPKHREEGSVPWVVRNVDEGLDLPVGQEVVTHQSSTLPVDSSGEDVGHGLSSKPEELP